VKKHILQKTYKKGKKQKRTSVNHNPFDSIYFWLSLATMDFPFEHFGNTDYHTPVKQQNPLKN
jgi:hypothetical protein